MIKKTNDVYRDIIIWEVIAMETAKTFEYGRSQAVRLPKSIHFNADEATVMCFLRKNIF